METKEVEEKGQSTLHIAAERNDPELVKLLLSRGADANHEDKEKRSPLSLALSSKRQTHAGKRCVELLLQHGAKLTQPDIGQLIVNESYAEPVLAHLAILEAAAAAESTLQEQQQQLLYRAIDTRPELRGRLESCREQLRRMKRERVYGSVTLFGILTDSQEKIVGYARHYETVASILYGSCTCHFDQYYCALLRRRVLRAAEIRRLRDRAALCIHDTWPCVFNHVIIDKIVAYLNYQDLQMFA